MHPLANASRRLFLPAILAVVAACSGAAAAQTGDTSIVKAVGPIQSAGVDSITVAAESGGNVIAKLAGNTKILRVPPGEKDLKNATPLEARDLQPGDRVLVRGVPVAAQPADHVVINALAVIVMKQADISAKQQRERDDWQKRGIGGLVGSVDAAANKITISAGGIGTDKTVTVLASANTILRRYAPGSVKFDDARPAPLDQIKAGDQLRARGARSADGSQVTAEEIVSGSFRNIAGTITTLDTAASTLTVQDLISKKPVLVKVSGDSQLKKLPPEMAQRIAFRLKSTVAAGEQSAGSGAEAQSSQSHNAEGRRGPEAASAHGANGGSTNGSPELQRLLSRLPASTLADLQKGDSILLVATQGADSGAVTAITLLAGVDPILAAASTRAASSLLSPWSLSTSGGEAEAGSQ